MIEGGRKGWGTPTDSYIPSHINLNTATVMATVTVTATVTLMDRKGTGIHTCAPMLDPKMEVDRE